MDSPDDVTGPVNVGNPTEFTIRELAELVVTLTASHSQLVYKPLPADDPQQRQPDITLARSLLGWEPATALREGLDIPHASGRAPNGTPPPYAP